MSTQNKLILRRFFEELFNQGNLAAADEIVDANYLNHNAAPGETPGRAGLTQFITYLHSAFRDLNFTIEDQVAEGDKVVTRVTLRGTHQGETEEFGPPTGRQVELKGITISRIEGGKIVEDWDAYDNLSAMQQLGLAPEQQ